MEYSTIELTGKEKEFFEAYIDAVYFTDAGGEDQPKQSDTLDNDFVRESVIDCLAMLSRIDCYLSDDNIGQAGHDFWLTRNGHGAGYWDRPEIYGEYYAVTFTTYAESFGEAYVVFNEDDGLGINYG